MAAWVDDLHGDHLNDAGRSFFTSLDVRDLSRRLEVIDTLRRHPEIDDVVIPPIVYLTGTIRSGTTLFHNAISLHAKAKALLRRELMEPVPPPERATARTDARIARVQSSIDERRATPLEGMHRVNADKPEECQWGSSTSCRCSPEQRMTMGLLVVQTRDEVALFQTLPLTRASSSTCCEIDNDEWT